MMLISIKSYPTLVLIMLPIIHSLYPNTNRTLNDSRKIETSTIHLLSNSSSFLHTTPLSTSTLSSKKTAEYIPPILSLPSTARPRLSSLQEPNTSAIAIGTKGSYNVTAASLDFIRLPACTKSWLSRLAASNGTVMTTFVDILTLSLSSNSTTAHVPGGSAGIDVIGPTTQTFTMGTLTLRLYDNDVCCGTCNILYPNVVVYYWPVLKNNNTWCLQYLNNSNSPASPTNPLNAPPSASSGPTLLPDTSLLGSMVNEKAPSFPRLTSEHRDPNYGPRVGFGAHLPPRAVEAPAVMSQASSPKAPSNSLQARTFIPLNESRVFAVIDGSTFISPTVYVAINTIKAVNKCKTVGHVFTSITLSFLEDQLSTVDGMFGQTRRFDFADLPCPPENWFTNHNIPNPIVDNSAMQSYFVNEYRPRIQVDRQILKNLDPEWKSCNILDIGNGYDPPRTLVPAGVLTDDDPTLATKPTPAPHSVAESPGPRQTSKYSSIAHSPSMPTNDPPTKPENPLNTQRPNYAQPPATTAISPGDPLPSPRYNSDVFSTRHEDPGSSRIRISNPNSIYREPSGEGKNMPASILPAHFSVLPVQPLIAGGFELTPAQAQATSHQPDAVPIAIGDLILAPFNPKTAPPDWKSKLNAPVIIDGLTLNPAPQNPIDLPPTRALATASQTVPIDSSGYSVAGKFLEPGGPAITVSGTMISLGLSNLVIGTKTLPLATASPSESTIVIAGQTFIAYPTGFLIDGKPLSPGGPAITISGTQISLGSSQTQIGVQNFLLTLPLSVPAPSVLTIEGKMFTANPSGFSIGGAELYSGGPRTTISGTPMSLGSAVIEIGTSIVSLSQSSNPTGLDPSIRSVSGFSVIATPTDRSSSPNSDAFISAKGKLGTSAILMSLCLGISVFIMTRLM